MSSVGRRVKFRVRTVRAAVHPTAGADASRSEDAGRAVFGDLEAREGRVEVVPGAETSAVSASASKLLGGATVNSASPVERGDPSHQSQMPRASKRKAEEQITEHCSDLPRKRNQVFSINDEVIAGDAGKQMSGPLQTTFNSSHDSTKSPALTSASSDFRCTICHLDFPDAASHKRHRKTKQHKRLAKAHKRQAKISQAMIDLEHHRTRIEAAVTPRGEIAIKKCTHLTDRNHIALLGNAFRGKKKKKKWKKGACLMAVTPNHLFRMHCTIASCRCSLYIDPHSDKSVTEYLWCRRQTKKFAGLLSLCLKLDSQSYNYLSGAASSLGIGSNTVSIHLTLLEGIKPEYSSVWFERMASSLELLYKALMTDSYITVVGLRRVPRQSEEGTALIVADVSISREAQAARDRIMKAYRVWLPQFQLHIALGACDEASVDSILNELNQRWIGQRLSLDFRSLTVLAPTMQEKKYKGEVSQEAIERQARYAKAFGPVIFNANEVASRLNKLLRSIMKKARYLSAPVVLEHKTYVRSEEESDAEVLAQASSYKSKIDFLCLRADKVLKEVEDALSLTNKPV
ncbi:hypothetical protein THAOC_28699 [Thalassiosira oceanica]|uniref:C2H2-type domain-containing protein n=1 Tax=Thalassiosira oceanica TaxID=159749 RepID=K0RT42_THAOC|nr:hypothetical protein THAOC_28699 [Thalassiosira oceanica]|eukprot:EJK52071.1 hypothetical protein THAOC_28699 [Thalassiosira oceanica]